MRIRRRVVRIVATLAGAAVALTAAVGGPTSASAVQPTPPSVQILSPTGDQTVSGTVHFTAAVDQEDSAHPVTDIFFEIYGATQGVQTRDITVTPDQCAPTCQIGVDFDTKGSVARSEVRPGIQPVPELSDGVAEFGVSVYTSFGPTAFASTNVSVDNHRPTLSAPSVAYDPATRAQPVWAGIGTISTHLDGAPNPETQQAITSYRLIFDPLDSEPSAIADQVVAAPDGGSGLVMFNLREAQPSGYYYGDLLAVDAAGTESTLIPVWISVGSPYSLRASVTAAHTDQASLLITPTWHDGTDASQTWISAVTVSRNGVIVGSGTNLTATHDSVALTLAAPGNGKLQTGLWNFTITTTDNFGVTQTALAGPNITDPVTAAWTTGTVVAGTAPAILAVVHDASTSPIATAVLDADGRTLATESPTTGSSQVNLAAPASTRFSAGTHTLAATVTLANGRSFVLTHVLTALAPVTLSLSAPPTAVWGSRIALSAGAATGAMPRAGLRLLLQSQTMGSASWVTRGTATSGANGTAKFTIAASAAGSARWRVTAAATANTAAAGSPVRALPVTAHFGKLPAARSVLARHAITETLTVSPYQATARVTLQYRPTNRTAWTSLSSAAISRAGAVSLRVSLPKPGHYQLRAVRTGPPNVASTTSGAWLATVTP